MKGRKKPIPCTIRQVKIHTVCSAAAVVNEHDTVFFLDWKKTIVRLTKREANAINCQGSGAEAVTTEKIGRAVSSHLARRMLNAVMASWMNQLYATVIKKRRRTSSTSLGFFIPASTIGKIVSGSVMNQYKYSGLHFYMKAPNDHSSFTGLTEKIFLGFRPSAPTYRRTSCKAWSRERYKRMSSFTSRLRGICTFMPWSS